MLFNSYAFIFAFLPLVWLTISLVGRRSVDAAKFLLFTASIVFYAAWDATYLWVLGALMVVTYSAARMLLVLPAERRWARFALVSAGIVANLGALGYFKYTNFLLEIVDQLRDVRFDPLPIVLPLGLSFFVFQKIAFLVDVYNGAVKRVSLLNFCLFVTFFPLLVAGPIVHHTEVVPQFERADALRPRTEDLAAGIGMFVVGLFKKVVIADIIAPAVNTAFETGASGAHLSTAASWLACVGYTLQVYFDFSGYSDMAVGLGLLFGIRLPQNFNSPLKATSIIEFWNRWHMSLTRFLTAYLYNPLAIRITRWLLTRGFKAKRGRFSPIHFVAQVVVPTLVTMLLAGIWHGAGWQFAVFGLVHGSMLVVNHGLRIVRPVPAVRSAWATALCRVGTFVLILPPMLLFRAPTLAVGAGMMADLFRWHPGDAWTGTSRSALMLVVALVVAQVLPSSHEWMLPDPDRDRLTPRMQRLRWSRWMAAAVAALGLIAVTRLSAPSDFLYFQF